jgi:dihydroorotase
VTTFDLVVRNGLVATRRGLQPWTVCVSGGRIVAVVEAGEPVAAAEELDASGLWVLPGVIDAHVHLREPGMTHKEDFSTGTAAAARGGVTTIADMPNTLPPTTTGERYREKLALVAPRARVDFALWAGASDPAELDAFAELGAIGVKVYMTEPSQGSQYPAELGIRDDGHLYDVLARAVHLATPSIEARLRRTWAGRPLGALVDEIAGESRLDKLVAADRLLRLARATGARVHVAHVPAPVVPLLIRARAAGVRVTSESFAPFMSTELLPIAGVLGFDRYRRPDEVELLWKALGRGDVELIATDHAPHTLEEKRRGDVDVLDCASGYPELETFVPMLVDAVHAGRISVERLVAVISAMPARLLRLDDRKGAIEPGLDADLTLVDPDSRWVIRGAELATRCRWTPFEGREVRGRVVATLLRGTLAMKDGEVLAAEGDGRYLTPAGAPSGVEVHAS